MQKNNQQENFYCYIPTTPGSAVPGMINIPSTTYAGGVPNVVGQQTAPLLLNSDADFIWEQAMFVAALTGGGADVSGTVLATVQISDSASGQTSMFFAPVHIRNAFGSGQLPYYLPRPITFAARSSLLITVQNLSLQGTGFDGVDFFLYLGGTNDYTQGQGQAQ